MGVVGATPPIDKAGGSKTLDPTNPLSGAIQVVVQPHQTLQQHNTERPPIQCVVHVDVLSLYAGDIYKAAPILLAQPEENWTPTLEPLIASLAASIGKLHTVRLHVDGSLLNTNVKAVRTERARVNLEAALLIQTMVAKRKADQKGNRLTKDEIQSLQWAFPLTCKRKAAICRAIGGLLGYFGEGSSVCLCENEADVCIACCVREASNVPVVVISGDTDLIFHCAGYCPVLLLQMRGRQIAQMRSYNHPGVASIAATFGLPEILDICRLAAAAARNDYFHCDEIGIVTAAKCIMACIRFEATWAGITVAEFCQRLQDPDLARMFVDVFKASFMLQMYKIGGKPLAQSFSNAFAVFLNRDETGADIGEFTDQSHGCYGDVFAQMIPLRTANRAASARKK
ncbi:hypothetical protein BC831DRAFT_93519 [Entophlyctis helioformis]|nr:hypothetical protein BC831DRAFT_93519 [Entophlyctis helioformis]